MILQLRRHNIGDVYGDVTWRHDMVPSWTHTFDDFLDGWHLGRVSSDESARNLQRWAYEVWKKLTDFRQSYMMITNTVRNAEEGWNFNVSSSFITQTIFCTLSLTVRYSYSPLLSEQHASWADCPQMLPQVRLLVRSEARSYDQKALADCLQLRLLLAGGR